MSRTPRRAVTRSDPAPTQQPAALPLLDVLRRHWLVVLAAAALAAAGAYGVSTQVMADVYRSSATVIINQADTGSTDQAPALEPFTSDQSLGETFEQLAVQPAVSEQVAGDLGIRASALRSATTVHAIPRTPLIIISVEGNSPQAAARRTQAYTAEFVQSTLGNGVLPGRAMVVSGATFPTEPVAPRPLLNALIAGTAAALVGLGLLYARTLPAAVRASAAPVMDTPQRAWLVRQGDGAADHVEDADRAYDLRGGA